VYLLIVKRAQPFLSSSISFFLFFIYVVIIAWFKITRQGSTAQLKLWQGSNAFEPCRAVHAVHVNGSTLQLKI